ncbi:hypothetical protein D3C87_1618360 [compost metagenome]
MATRSTSFLLSSKFKWFCPRSPTPIMATLTLSALVDANKEPPGKTVAAAAVMLPFLTNSRLFILFTSFYVFSLVNTLFIE